MNKLELQEIKNLQGFATEHGMNASKLAHELGYTRERICQFFRLQTAITDGFRWRFFQRFGLDAAQTVFAGASSDDSTNQGFIEWK